MPFKAWSKRARKIGWAEPEPGLPLSSLVAISKELGVTNDSLLTGKEGTATETIPAIKADKSLRPEVKKALISLIDELGRTT